MYILIHSEGGFIKVLVYTPYMCMYNYVPRSSRILMHSLKTVGSSIPSAASLLRCTAVNKLTPNTILSSIGARQAMLVR